MSDISSYLGTLTLKAKACFIMLLAEQAYKEIDKSIDGIGVARNALDSAWQWLGGANVDEDNFYTYIENVNDTGLYFYGSILKKENIHLSNLFNVILISIMYTSSQIYKASGCKYVPQTLEEVDDEFIDQLIRYLEKTDLYDQDHIESLKLHFTKHHAANFINEVGGNIEKNNVMNVRLGRINLCF